LVIGGQTYEVTWIRCCSLEDSLCTGLSQFLIRLLLY